MPCYLKDDCLQVCFRRHAGHALWTEPRCWPAAPLHCPATSYQTSTGSSTSSKTSTNSSTSSDHFDHDICYTGTAANLHEQCNPGNSHYDDRLADSSAIQRHTGNDIDRLYEAVESHQVGGVQGGQGKVKYLATQSKKGTAEYSERINPCAEGIPLMNEFDSPVTCNFAVQPNGGCPEDYWCHTGASFATTACCPIVNWSKFSTQEDPS